MPSSSSRSSADAFTALRDSTRRGFALATASDVFFAHAQNDVPSVGSHQPFSLTCFSFDTIVLCRIFSVIRGAVNSNMRAACSGSGNQRRTCCRTSPDSSSHPATIRRSGEFGSSASSFQSMPLTRSSSSSRCSLS